MRTVSPTGLLGKTSICYPLVTSILLIVAPLDVSGANDGNAVFEEIRPSQTDLQISSFDEPNYVFSGTLGTPAERLVVFFPGTNGKPQYLSTLLGFVARLGYRVIGLEYNNSPAVVDACASKRNPECSAQFREERVRGDVANAVVKNSVAESITNRLTKVIQYQIEHSPGAGWESFLVDDHPAWGRVILSGVSQGAGMAAFIAKRERVARVVLFSGPWDYVERPENLAPWIVDNSETPTNVWYAEYHRRERNASAIAKAYAALGIDASHVLIFDLDLPAAADRSIDYDLYHISTVRLESYSAQWRLLFGGP